MLFSVKSWSKITVDDVELVQSRLLWRKQEFLQVVFSNSVTPFFCRLIFFFRIDNDNHANFRDNYRHWWFRLTTHFCDSFKDIVGEEKVKYKKVLTFDFLHNYYLHESLINKSWHDGPISLRIFIPIWVKKRLT